jgi:hypothetical protein
MELLIRIISFVLLIGLVGTPILLFVRIQKVGRLKFKFLIYLVLGLIFTAGITLTFAWWADTSNRLLLNYYGYDFDAMDDADRFAKVSDENLERVKTLEISFFGIGWPLKAIMTYMFYSPYLLIVYTIGQFRRRRKRNKTEHAPNNGYNSLPGSV